jgi:hypothetical protein
MRARLRLRALGALKRVLASLRAHEGPDSLLQAPSSSQMRSRRSVPSHRQRCEKNARSMWPVRSLMRT